MEPQSGRVERIVVGDVLMLTLINPPNNGLTPAMRAQLIDALSAPGEVTKVVLNGKGRVFSSGLALDLPEGLPTVRSLCMAVEACPVPVIAALSGNCVGPGAELALAAHARVADESARLSFMDVALGLLSEAGATIRLPKLVGAKEALRLLLTGRSIGATEALAIGLIDYVVERDAVAGALSLQLRDTEKTPASERTSGMRDPLGYQQALAQARGDAAFTAQPACRAILDCVDAALVLPSVQAFDLEETLHGDLLETAEAAGLKSAFLAERRAAALPGPIAAAMPKAVAHIGLVGVGGGMPYLAFMAVSKGFKVTWFSDDRDALKSALQTVAVLQEKDVTAGRLSQTARDADWARLAAVNDLSALREAGLFLVAPAEIGLAAKLDALASQSVLIALGGAEGRIGLSLAPSGKSCEVAFPDGVSAEAAASAVGVTRRLGLFPVLVAKAPVAGQRVIAAGQAALRQMVQMGVAPNAIAACLSGFGFAAHGIPDLATQGTTTMPKAEILARWLGAMGNEGFRLLASGVARRPSDIDHCLVMGHGFPRAQGGPMHQANRRGLIVFRADLRKWQSEHAVWAPAPLIDKLISDGKMIAALNTR